MTARPWPSAPASATEVPLPMALRHRWWIVVVIGIALMSAGAPSAEPVRVRYVEGLVHGFLSLRSPEGRLLANGDLLQTAQGDRVTTRLVFHFNDGSLSDE